jgi:SOS-response transcriptional repressor LexA
VKHLSLPASEALDDLLPPAEQHAGALQALARLHDEAVADAVPILVEANLWLQTSELAGMPVVQIRGDSMEPALRNGDHVLLDTDDTDVSPGGIFALLDENGSLIIKQVEIVRQSNGGQRISCMSRNSAYSPFELTLGEEAKIIGRVAQRITRYL